MFLNFRELEKEEKDAMADAMFEILEGPEDLRNWCLTYLDLDLVDNHVDPDSNTSPIEAAWEIYDAVKHNKGDEITGFIMLSCRTGYKTVTASILETLLLVHFQITISHMAAIQSQSQKAVQYISSFFTKIKPLLDHKGWISTSTSKNKIQFQTPEGKSPYIVVIVLTMQGANSEHTNIACIEENELVMVENDKTTTNRKRRQIPAKTICKRLNKNRKVRAYTVNHETGNLEFCDITGFYKSKKQLMRITTENNKQISVSPDHKVFVFGKGYINAIEVSNGDSLVSLGRSKTGTFKNNTNLKPLCQAIRKKTLNLEKVTNIELYNKEVNMIDFTVEKNHNFLVNSILVHNCIDEVDVVREPAAYEEARAIPAVESGRYPLTIKLSTRKFAGGLMQSELDNAEKKKERVLNWNVIDVTEACLPDRHKPEEPKVRRYVSGKTMPLINVGPKEYQAMDSKSQEDLSEIEAYSGCASCKLLPVCRTRLAQRPQDDIGGFYKPIQSVINEFTKYSDDMGESQLMCWRPSTKGLVYPRFDMAGNTLTVDQAVEKITGNKSSGATVKQLADTLRYLGIPMYVGLDWGFTHKFAMVLVAALPGGDYLLMDCFARTEMEFDDILTEALRWNELYTPSKWFCDTSMPAYIKSFRKKKLKCPSFKKDVKWGIDSTRFTILSSSGRRRLFVLRTENNDEEVIQGIQKHRFKTDHAGKSTGEPDDSEWADVMDAVRYVFQNIVSGGKRPAHTSTQGDPAVKEREFKKKMPKNRPLSEEIAKRVTEPSGIVRKSKTGKVFFSR